MSQPIAGDPSLLSLFEGREVAVLTTLKRDGRPQLSNVTYLWDADAGQFQISVTEPRAKTRNLQRDPRASLYVSTPDGWSYAVAEADALMTPVTTDPRDEVADALVDLYRRIRGQEHPDWDEYRTVMVQEQRLVLTLVVTRVYGLVQG